MMSKKAAAREATDLRKNVARKGCCESEFGNISAQEKAAAKANLAAGLLDATISHKSGARKGRCKDESGKNSEHEEAAAKTNYATNERADTKANLAAGALEAAILTTTAPEKAVAKAKWVGRCKSELGSRNSGSSNLRKTMPKKIAAKAKKRVDEALEAAICAKTLPAKAAANAN